MYIHEHQPGIRVEGYSEQPARLEKQRYGGTISEFGNGMQSEPVSHRPCSLSY